MGACCNYQLSITFVVTVAIIAVLTGRAKQASFANSLTHNMRSLSQSNVSFDAFEEVDIYIADHTYQDDYRSFILFDKLSSFSVVPIAKTIFK